MKFEPNHIDEIFKHRLHHAEVAPPVFVWDNLERELRKRRRRFFLWFFAFGMAGAGLWGLMSRREANHPSVFSRNAPETNLGFGQNKLQNAAPLSEQPNSSASSSSPIGIGATVHNPKTSLGNTSAKKGLAAFSVVVPALKNKGEDNILTVNEKTLESNQSEIFRQLAPISQITTEPLVYARKNIFPKANPFIRKKKDPKYCYDFAQDPNVLMVDAYLGPSFTKQTFGARNSTFEPYRQQRLATERPDWAFNAGLRGSLLLGRHFLLRTGVHYEQTTEEFEYIDPNYVKYIVEIVQKVIDNQLVTIIDTVDVEYGENYTKTYNRYGFLDIPLEAGGEVRRGRFGLSVHAGISFNVLFLKSGTILSQGDGPVPFTPGKEGATEVFRPRTGLSAGASAQFFVHLQPRLRVFAEPYFRSILKPVTLDQQPVEQRYHSSGIKFGLTKILD